jgi:hypothetical protein
MEPHRHTQPAAGGNFTQDEYTHDVVFDLDGDVYPATSALKEGERVLGYAACVVSDVHRVPKPHDE